MDLTAMSYLNADPNDLDSATMPGPKALGLDNKTIPKFPQ